MQDQIANGEAKSQIKINDKIKDLIWHISATIIAASIIGMIVMYGVSQSQKSDIKGLEARITLMQTSITRIETILMTRTEDAKEATKK